MILAEAVKLVEYHQNMLSDVDQFTPEYIADLQDPFSEGSGLKLSQALEIVLKGANTDGQNYPKAS